jgi:hypothetical protein
MMDTSTAARLAPDPTTAGLKLGRAKLTWQSLAFVCCVLFGVCLTYQALGAGDGTWFWCSLLFLQGKKLYADMHLVQQPLIILESAAVLKLFGKGWIISRIPAVFHLLAYCTALSILIGKSALSDAKKAILFGCCFFISIFSATYRFEDYFILCDSFALYSLIAVLCLFDASTRLSRAALLVAAGVLCGLSLTTRLNYGAALLAGVVLILLFSTPKRKTISLLILFLSAVSTVLLVVLLTGDSLHEYLASVVFKAAASKGGIGHVLTDPLRVPLLAATWLIANANVPVLVEAGGAALAWAFLLKPKTEPRTKTHIAIGLLGVTLVVLFCRHTVALFFSPSLFTDLAGFAAIFLFPIGVWVLARSGRRSVGFGQGSSFSVYEILLIIPIGQFAAGTMSTAGYFLELWPPLAAILALSPLCLPLQLKREWSRDLVFAIMALVMLSAATRRIVLPYWWHSYQEQTLFTGRMLFYHPAYGPMIIDRDLVEFIQPICRDVTEGDSNPELLSMPFPFANYFCAVPPWRGYVQTFYDITSRQTIETLVSQLEASPPKWILYQKQVHSLRWHEILLNNGQPLAHRDLEKLIDQKLAHNEWHVVYTSDFSNNPPWDTHWFLIRTD